MKRYKIFIKYFILKFASYLDFGSYCFLSESEHTKAEKYLKEIYPCSANRYDGFENSTNDNDSTTNNLKSKSKLANLATQLGILIIIKN